MPCSVLASGPCFRRTSRLSVAAACDTWRLRAYVHAFYAICIPHAAATVTTCHTTTLPPPPLPPRAYRPRTAPDAPPHILDGSYFRTVPSWWRHLRAFTFRLPPRLPAAAVAARLPLLPAFAFAFCRLHHAHTGSLYTALLLVLHRSAQRGRIICAPLDADVRGVDKPQLAVTVGLTTFNPQPLPSVYDLHPPAFGHSNQQQPWTTIAR